MMHTIRQWISRALALALIGPLAASVAQGPVAADGSGSHTLLTVESLRAGLVALLLVGGLLAIAAVVAKILSGRREALLCMSFVLGWVAWTSGRLGHVYQLPHAGTASVRLAIEGVLLTLLVFAVGALISRDREQDRMSSFSPHQLRSSLMNRAMLGAMGAGLVGAGVLAWLFARTDMPGQSVGVAMLAGMGGGVAGALVAGSMQGKDKHAGTLFAPIMLGVMLCGVISSLLGIFVPGSNALGSLARTGDLPGYLAISPAAWAMGALLGVPVGLGWVEHSQSPQTQATPRSA